MVRNPSFEHCPYFEHSLSWCFLYLVKSIGLVSETSFWTYIWHLGHWPSFVVVVKMTQKHVIWRALVCERNPLTFRESPKKSIMLILCTPMRPITDYIKDASHFLNDTTITIPITSSMTRGFLSIFGCVETNLFLPMQWNSCSNVLFPVVTVLSFKIAKNLHC